MSSYPHEDRSEVENRLLSKLAREQIISNDGLQPTSDQWETIAVKFNASINSKQATKTELSKLWRSMRRAAEYSREQFGDTVLEDPLLGEIDRLFQVNPLRNSKKTLKSPSDVPSNLPRRSKRRLYSAGSVESMNYVDDDGNMIVLSNELPVPDIQEEFMDHLNSKKRKKTKAKRSTISRKSGVNTKRAANVDEKQSTKSQEKSPVRNNTHTAGELGTGTKSCPVMCTESSNIVVRSILKPSVSQPGTEVISPPPGTPYPTFVPGTMSTGTPAYLKFKVATTNTQTTGNGNNSVIAGMNSTPEKTFLIPSLLGNLTHFQARNQVMSQSQEVQLEKFQETNQLAGRPTQFVNNFGTAKNNSGLIAKANTVTGTSNHGKITHITRDGNFIFPVKADNPRIVTYNAGMIASNSVIVSSSSGIVASSSAIMASNCRMVNNNCGTVNNNSEMAANNTPMVSNNAGMTNSSQVVAPTRKVVRIPYLKPIPGIPTSSYSLASGVNSQQMAAQLTTSTPEKTYMIPSALLKDSTNFQARNQVTSQSQGVRFEEEFQETKLRQAKELHEAQKKLHEAQIIMDKKIAEQSKELHDAKMKTEVLVADQQRKFLEEKRKLEEENLKQSSALEQNLHDAKMRSEEEIAEQRRMLHEVNFRAIERSMEFSQQLHNVEMEVARLKRDEAITNNKIAMLQLKKLEVDLMLLNAT